MALQIGNIHRIEPESEILYRLRYRCDVQGAAGGAVKVEVSFVVELNPLGERSVYWDFGKVPVELSEKEQAELMESLQAMAHDDQLPR